MISEIPIPDVIFYYALSSLLAVALFWLVARYINKLDALLDKLTENDIKQDSKLERHDERIEDLEKFKDSMHIVKYKQSEA